MATFLFLFFSFFMMLDVAQAKPRAYLQTDAGFIKPDKLSVEGRVHTPSNFIMNTYDIEELEYLKDINGNAWQAMSNHYQYGVVGTRGFIGGALLAVVTLLVFRDRVSPVVPVGLFLAGFTYGMNSRHMARHYLHNAINTINGVYSQNALELSAPQISYTFRY